MGSACFDSSVLCVGAGGSFVGAVVLIGASDSVGDWRMEAVWLVEESGLCPSGGSEVVGAVDSVSELLVVSLELTTTVSSVLLSEVEYGSDSGFTEPDSEVVAGFVCLQAEIIVNRSRLIRNTAAFFIAFTPCRWSTAILLIKAISDKGAIRRANLNHINHRLSSGSVRPSIEKALDCGDRFDSGDSFLFSESQVVIRG